MEQATHVFGVRGVDDRAAYHRRVGLRLQPGEDLAELVEPWISRSAKLKCRINS
jgi:hypothetical protein